MDNKPPPRRKTKGSVLYSAFIYYVYLKALRHGSHSFTCKYTIPAFRMRSPDGATCNWGKRHLIAAYYSSIDPERMKGWVGLLGWPIADSLPTLSGHPSATGRAQDRESTPAEDRRSTTVPRNQPRGGLHPETLWLESLPLDHAGV